MYADDDPRLWSPRQATAASAPRAVARASAALRALDAPGAAPWWDGPGPGTLSEVVAEHDRLVRLARHPGTGMSHAAPRAGPAAYRAAVCGMCSRRLAITPCPCRGTRCVLRDHPALVLRAVRDALAEVPHDPAD